MKLLNEHDWRKVRDALSNVQGISVSSDYPYGYPRELQEVWTYEWEDDR